MDEYHPSLYIRNSRTPCVLSIRCGCIIAVLYPWYYTTVLYNTMKCALCYTAPFELWILFDDRCYDAIRGHLSALHKTPTRASGGVCNLTRRSYIVAHELDRLGKHKIETGTAVLFDSKQLNRQIATTRDTKFCKWLLATLP